MSVDNPNGQYNEMLPIWDEMDDVCDGERSVKKMREAYLPMICSCETDAENLINYDKYLKRAVFYPIAKNTLESNIGLAFAEDPSFEPDGLDFLKSDADGAGTSLYQQAQICLGYQLKYGRGGYFVDYPQVSGGVSKSDVIQKGIRPTVILYSAKSIINWRVRKVRGVYKTCLVVLYEESSQTDPTDEFKEKIVKIYRVLRLDDADKYCMQVYSDESGAMVAGEVQYPRNSRGSNWNEIPFIAVGSQSNDFKLDAIPLEPIVSVNLAHYRNSAEYEQSLFYTSQVQPVVSELDFQTLETLGMVDSEGKQIKKFTLGAYTVLTLPQGAKFDFVQAEGNSLAKEGMTEKLSYMQLLGAKITENNEVAKTATQSDNEQMTKHSVLSLCVANLNEAMEKVLFWVAEYHGSGLKAKFTVKQDFAKGRIGLEELKFWQSEYVANNISAETYFAIKMTGKKPEVDFEQEQKRIEQDRNAIIG